MREGQTSAGRGWLRSFSDTSILSYSMHPGWVDTPGLSVGLPLFSRLAKPFLRTPGERTDTIVWLASGAARVQGARSGFFLDRARRSESRSRVPVSTQTEDAALLAWRAARTGLPVAGTE